MSEKSDFFGNYFAGRGKSNKLLVCHLRGAGFEFGSRGRRGPEPMASSQDSLGDEAERFDLACEVSHLQSVERAEGEAVADAMHDALVQSQREAVAARAGSSASPMTQQRQVSLASRKSVVVKTEPPDDDVVVVGSKRPFPTKAMPGGVAADVDRCKAEGNYMSMISSDEEEEDDTQVHPVMQFVQMAPSNAVDSQQAKAIEAATAGLNVLLVGGAGSGKTFVCGKVVEQLPADKTGAILGSNWQSLKVVHEKLEKALGDVKRMAKLRFMTVNKGAGVNRDDAWDVGSIEANREEYGRRGLEDVACSDFVLVEEVGQICPKHITVLFETVKRVRLAELNSIVKMLVGDTQTKAIGDGDGEAEWFFESDAVDESFVIVPLLGNHRVQAGDDPRVPTILRHIKMRIDEESVREFFRVAATVDLTAHERDVLHLFWSNDDAARFASKDLKRMHSTVRDVHLDPKRKLSYDTRLAFGSRFVWDLVLVPGATYVYSGGESIVSVANTQLRNKDVLICVRVADGSGDPVFKVKSGLQFVLRQVEFRAEYPASSGNFVAVKAYPIKYNMYAPVFSKQGSEADYVHVHCEKLRGDNVLYTAVTRCRGSPFTGQLKLTDLYTHQKRPSKNHDGTMNWTNSKVLGEEALRLKWTTCPKSIVFQSIVFGDVPAEVLAEHEAKIPDTPHWRKVRAKLQRMRVLR